MAITFVKDTNGKVIVTRDGVKYSLDGTMNVIAHPADSEVIIITDSSAPLEQREVLKFGWAEVTTPVASDRNDLIEKLGKNFFYNSFSGSVTIPPGLATETTLVLIKGFVDGIETLLTTLNAKDFATETTLVTKASEATLIQVRDYLDTVESLLTTLNGKDFATENTVNNLYVATAEQTEWSNSQSTTTVSASVTSVLLKAANGSRKQISIRNDSNKTLYICLFNPATTSTPFILSRGEVWTFPRWRGNIYGIWDTGATGDAYITEELP